MPETGPHLSIHWMPSIESIDWSTFPDCLLKNRIVVVHFWAIWYGYGLKFDTTIYGLQKDFDGMIKFLSQDIDQEECWNLAEKCKIRNIPALSVFVNGEFKNTIIGMQSAQKLKSIFDGWIARGNDDHGN